LANKLIILKYGQYLIVLVDLADILAGPHEGHELAKKLIILEVTVPDGIGGAGRHPGPQEGHEWPRN
jgi:hypothetical protein